MNKLTNRILILSSLFLVFTIGISFALYTYSESAQAFCATELPEFYCGTESSVLTEKGQVGKQIFNANCAACHKLNKRMTGPALAKTDSILFWNWMTLKNNRLDSTKFKELGIEYHQIQWSQLISESELNALFEYLNTP
ncbi:cytochrome c [Gilvibacter sediminis]|uniref:cytochrome c n=1 Tax=Gilvibacter sediminis TaxID=379071 RepID=UPI002350B63A|nr:cytochrome c [Gilvibacter sediminis]MDC7998020.1 cytochrome c [Gilvibacter sediminis]